MLSQEDADACLEAESADLKQLNYEELLTLATRADSEDGTTYRELEVSGETVYVNIMIGTLGRIRKRVCVEMMLSAEGGTFWPRTPCVYFERYESGRLYVARATRLQIAVIKSLPYVFLCFVVSGLTALLWYVFLRGG